MSNLINRSDIKYDVCEYKEHKNKFGSHRFITSCGKVGKNTR